LKAIGKRVPEDVLLAGVNGDPVAEEATPPLTTVVQPCHEIGETAVSLMFERLANSDFLPREVFLSAKLQVRESTKFDKKKREVKDNAFCHYAAVLRRRRNRPFRRVETFRHERNWRNGGVSHSRTW
jgi:hypothetical protein